MYLCEENVRIKVPLIFIVIYFIGDYEFAFDIKVANVSPGADLEALSGAGWVCSHIFLCSPSFAYSETLRPDRNFSNRFRGAPSREKVACTQATVAVYFAPNLPPEKPYP